MVVLRTAIPSGVFTLGIYSAAAVNAFVIFGFVAAGAACIICGVNFSAWRVNAIFRIAGIYRISVTVNSCAAVHAVIEIFLISTAARCIVGFVQYSSGSMFRVLIRIVIFNVVSVFIYKSKSANCTFIPIFFTTAFTRLIICGVF